MSEWWACDCGERNSGNFCTACGKRRGEIWTALWISYSDMTMTGGYRFALKEDGAGRMRLCGECCDGSRRISIRESAAIAVDGAVIEKLRGMELDTLPIRPKRSPVPAGYPPLDGMSQSLTLTYPDGTSYSKKVPEELRSDIRGLLARELIKNGAAAEDPKKDAASFEEMRLWSGE